MPRVQIPITDIVKEGVAPPAQTSSDATNDHYLPYNDGKVILEISNVNASPQTVTFITPGSQSGLGIDDLIVSIPASTGVRWVGSLSPALFNQPDGTVNIDVAVATDVKFRAYHVA